MGDRKLLLLTWFNRSFDSILKSYEDLAATALRTLHLEIRCRIIQSLQTALSPETTAPYLLDQEVNEPDPEILSLNAEMLAYDEITSRFLREREVEFVRNGLGLLINTYLIGNAPRMVAPMNAKGCGRMQLNILVLQQNLKNIEESVDLVRAANYFELFDKGPAAIIDKAREQAEAAAAAEAEEEQGQANGEEAEAGTEVEAAGAGAGAGAGDEGEEGKEDAAGGESNPTATNAGVQAKDRFTYDELKALLELCFSEQLADPERGVAAAAKRQMGEKLLDLTQFMWQS